MQTTHLKLADVKNVRSWHFRDADGKILGRLATGIAMILMGKHKRTWSPHLDCGDFVVVTNASKVRVTGNKLVQKLYFRHSGFPAGGRTMSLGKMMEKKPDYVIELAVKRMLPKNKLADRMLTRLKIYAKAEHPHAGQIK